jgi:hypothetical protein
MQVHTSFMPSRAIELAPAFLKYNPALLSIPGATAQYIVVAAPAGIDFKQHDTQLKQRSLKPIHRHIHELTQMQVKHTVLR